MKPLSTISVAVPSMKFQGGLSQNLNFVKKRERKPCNNTVATIQL